MSIIGGTNPGQLHLDDSNDFVTVVSPREEPMGLDALILIFQANRAFFMDRLHRRGVLLFRGFEPPSRAVFQEMVDHGMALKPWNSFNLKGMPPAVSNWLRRYSEGLMGSGDYRRYLSRDVVQLGPAGESVQGPHVEGGGSPRRARYLALCCFEPSAYLAETAMVDLHAAYRRLPEPLQRKYSRAWNRFYFLTARPLRWLDRLLVSQSPLEVHEELSDGRAKLSSPLTPMVCLHPQTSLPCLQPWAFARNTNRHVHAAAQQVFTGRGRIDPCPNAQDTDYRWDLCDEHHGAIDWPDEEQHAFFEDLFRHAFLLAWRKGDIALIDNVRIGHWRMNGIQGSRELVQIQAEPFSALDHLPRDHAVNPPWSPSDGERRAAA